MTEISRQGPTEDLFSAHSRPKERQLTPRQTISIRICNKVNVKHDVASLNKCMLTVCRKMDGLEEVLGLYVTPQPLAVPQQGESRKQSARGFPTRERSLPTWNSAADQQVI